MLFFRERKVKANCGPPTVHVCNHHNSQLCSYRRLKHLRAEGHLGFRLLIFINLILEVDSFAASGLCHYDALTYPLGDDQACMR